MNIFLFIATFIIDRISLKLSISFESFGKWEVQFLKKNIEIRFFSEGVSLSSSSLSCSFDYLFIFFMKIYFYIRGKADFFARFKISVFFSFALRSSKLLSIFLFRGKNHTQYTGFWSTRRSLSNIFQYCHLNFLIKGFLKQFKEQCFWNYSISKLLFFHLFISLLVKNTFETFEERLYRQLNQLSERRKKEKKTNRIDCYHQIVQTSYGFVEKVTKPVCLVVLYHSLLTLYSNQSFTTVQSEKNIELRDLLHSYYNAFLKLQTIK